MGLQVALKEKDKESVVTVTWSPPLSANGIILDYQIHYEGYKNGEEKAAVSFC